MVVDGDKNPVNIIHLQNRSPRIAFLWVMTGFLHQNVCGVNGVVVVVEGDGRTVAGCEKSASR